MILKALKTYAMGYEAECIRYGFIKNHQTCAHLKWLLRIFKRFFISILRMENQVTPKDSVSADVKNNYSNCSDTASFCAEKPWISHTNEAKADVTNSFCSAADGKLVKDLPNHDKDNLLSLVDEKRKEITAKSSYASFLETSLQQLNIAAESSAPYVAEHRQQSDFRGANSYVIASETHRNIVISQFAENIESSSSLSSLPCEINSPNCHSSTVYTAASLPSTPSFSACAQLSAPLSSPILVNPAHAIQTSASSHSSSLLFAETPHSLSPSVFSPPEETAEVPSISSPVFLPESTEAPSTLSSCRSTPAFLNESLRANPPFSLPELVENEVLSPTDEQTDASFLSTSALPYEPSPLVGTQNLPPATRTTEDARLPPSVNIAPASEDDVPCYHPRSLHASLHLDPEFLEVPQNALSLSHSFDGYSTRRRSHPTRSSFSEASEEVIGGVRNIDYTHFSSSEFAFARRSSNPEISASSKEESSSAKKNSTSISQENSEIKETGVTDSHTASNTRLKKPSVSKSGKSSEDSLLRLFQSEYFDAFLHMFYLYHRVDAGVHAYLVNLLYTNRTNEEVEFYMPQLCQMSLVRYNASSIYRFLLDKASRSMHFALKASWLYHSIVEDKLPGLQESAHKMTQDTEMAVVNCKNGSFNESHKHCDLFLRRRILEGIRKNAACSAAPLPSTEVLEGALASTNSTESTLQEAKLPSLFRDRRGDIYLTGSRVKLPSIYSKLGDPLRFSTSQMLLSKEPWEVEDDLQQYLMKQRRCDYFNTLNHFISLVIDVSFALAHESDRPRRNDLLHCAMEIINEWMLTRRLMVAACEGTFSMAGLMIPMNPTKMEPWHALQILRIAVGECWLLSSKKRAPYLLVYEVADLDEDLLECVHTMEQWSSPGGGKRPSGDISPGGKKSLRSVASQEAWANTPLSMADMYIYPSLVKELHMYKLVESVEIEKYRLAHKEDYVTLIRDVLSMRKPPLPARGTPAPPVSPSLSPTTTQKFSHGFVHYVPSYAPPSQRDGDASSSNFETKKLKQHLWGELWEEKRTRLRQESPYGHQKSWDIRCVLVKGGDDLRQELLASQLMQQFKYIFDKAKLPLWLRPYEILVTGANSGIMEFVPDTCSVDMLKRRFDVDSIAKVFDIIFADNLPKARKCFIESHAAYSLVSYLLQVKDRHNGNLLLDAEGHLIHIDFGYMLSNCPGNINFETSPFKLTKEYLDIIGTEASENYEYFCRIIIQGFLEARKHADRIILVVDMMLSAKKMPCFMGGTQYALQNLKERFMLNITEKECIEKIVNLIETSLCNYRTIQYDYFQKFTNHIF